MLYNSMIKLYISKKKRTVRAYIKLRINGCQWTTYAWTGKLVIPLNREAPNFRSMIGMIDGRTELKPLPASGGPEDRRLQVVGVSAAAGSGGDDYYLDVESGSAAVPLVQQQYVNGRLVRLRTFSVFEVSMMAAKIAYENAAYIENVVNNVWKVALLFLQTW